MAFLEAHHILHVSRLRVNVCGVCHTSIQTALSARAEVTAISFQVVPLRRLLVAVLSLQVVEFDPRPIHVEILLDNVAPKRGGGCFSEHFLFPLLSFYQCSILIYWSITDGVGSQQLTAPLANTASLPFARVPVSYPQVVLLHDTYWTQLLIGRNEPQIKQVSILQTYGVTLCSLVGGPQDAVTWLFRNVFNHSPQNTISSAYLVLHRAYKIYRWDLSSLL